MALSKKKATKKSLDKKKKVTRKKLSKEKSTKRKKPRTDELLLEADSMLNPVALMSHHDFEKFPVPVTIPFSTEMASFILNKITEGETLTSVCMRDGVPSVGQVLRWMKEHKDFGEEYEMAREAQALIAHDKIVDIAHASVGAHKDNVAGLKLSFDANKFLAEKNDKKRYAKEGNSKGSGGTYIQINTGVSVDGNDERDFKDIVKEVNGLINDD